MTSATITETDVHNAIARMVGLPLPNVYIARDPADDALNGFISWAVRHHRDGQAGVLGDRARYLAELNRYGVMAGLSPELRRFAADAAYSAGIGTHALMRQSTRDVAVAVSLARTGHAHVIDEAFRQARRQVLARVAARPGIPARSSATLVGSTLPGI